MVRPNLGGFSTTPPILSLSKDTRDVDAGSELKPSWFASHRRLSGFLIKGRRVSFDRLRMGGYGALRGTMPCAPD